MGTIKHVFVLMLENRSFDHMLGFSGISGKDATSGEPIKVEGLQGNESNKYQDVDYNVSSPADFSMTVDPGHEFTNVLNQLSGPGAEYPPNGQYPEINNSGFVEDYVSSGGRQNPGEIMKCFDPSQLPVLVTLAKSFAICDNWFSSMSGPTWPNRFFLLAASSGGLDHGPSKWEMFEWESLDGFKFEKGSLFDKTDCRIYTGGFLCFAQSLRGVGFNVTFPCTRFAQDVCSDKYFAQFTLIKPNYGYIFNSYKGGNSQHPLDDVRSGEAFIKKVYETIRKSPIWETSMLIVTWDEHGGFYDHVKPPVAVRPGDNPKISSANKFKFTFDQYGPRVPAVVISPLIPKNLIDHRLYDHASVPATIEANFHLDHMTQRDAKANNLLSLVSLDTPRMDTPKVLPSPAAPESLNMEMRATMERPAPAATRPDESIESDPNIPGLVYVAMRNDLELSPSEQRSKILDTVQAIRTRRDARVYIEQVREKILERRARE